MPRGKKPEISYGKALRSPGKRQKPRTHPAHKPQMKKPQGLSELAEYVEENREYHDNTLQVIEEFQEDWCDHTKQRTVIADGPSKTLLKCPDCGHIQEKVKK